mmetsp:Transcript_53196/g.159238  ORF Transcript_53196/g.159238 Transcript_53196/m.159238 type:complete len:228 (+) Transcript_53196:768-1451(+)
MLPCTMPARTCSGKCSTPILSPRPSRTGRTHTPCTTPRSAARTKPSSSISSSSAPPPSPRATTSAPRPSSSPRTGTPSWTFCAPSWRPAPRPRVSATSAVRRRFRTCGIPLFTPGGTGRGRTGCGRTRRDWPSTRRRPFARWRSAAPRFWTGGVRWSFSFALRARRSPTTTGAWRSTWAATTATPPTAPRPPRRGLAPCGCPSTPHAGRWPCHRNSFASRCRSFRER